LDGTPDGVPVPGVVGLAGGVVPNRRTGRAASAARPPPPSGSRSHLRTHRRYACEIAEHRWGSEAKPVEPGLEIQDPYSPSLFPQILGAFQDAWWHVEYMRHPGSSTPRRTIPWRFRRRQSIIHCGNFLRTTDLDGLRLPAHRDGKSGVAGRAPARTAGELRYSQGLPPLLSGGHPGLNSGFAGAQLLATSLGRECRPPTPARLGARPSRPTPTTRTFVSMGCSSAKMTRELVAKAWKIVRRPGHGPGPSGRPPPTATSWADATGSCIGAWRRVSPRLTTDRPLFERSRPWRTC